MTNYDVHKPLEEEEWGMLAEALKAGEYAYFELSISEMGHFLNRTLWHNQAALTSSLGLWL